MSWLTARDALDILGVRPQTLYANVSRRRIRARSDPKDPRRSLYLEADVRKLAQARQGARKAERVAAGTIEWGDPILPSGISTVALGRLWYRGRDAVKLAEQRTLEEVACLLWDAPAGSLGAFVLRPGGPAGPAGRAARAARGRRWERVRRRARASSSREGVSRREAADSVLRSLFAAVADRAGTDPPSYGRALPVLRGEAADLLATLAGSVVGALDVEMSEAAVPAARESAAAMPIHERLAATWRRRRSADVLRRALVLLADHELNASTFATRVTVSTGASLASGILAGLATLSGPLHGRAALGVLDLIDTGRKRGMRLAVCDRLQEGRALNGFGHPLYPDGDVRAEALLRELELPDDYRQLRDVVEDLAGERPNIDFALAALTEVHRLPAAAPLIVFALARSVGWLAHALEQASTGHLIRPRARYVGPEVGAEIPPDSP